jgi:serine/threonine protein phosphatase PrpC
MVQVKSGTDVGLKRAQNEDSCAFWIPEDPVDCHRGVLLVVADGMGGTRAGEVASQLAVGAVVRSYRESTGEAPLEDLVRSLEIANRVVYEQSLAQPDLRGMGTTCTAAVIHDGRAHLAHVGDSRAYLVRDGGILQLTRDHSLVAQLVENRHLTPEQARVDPRRNLVTRSMGVAASVVIDAERIEEPLRDGDTMLLCTDGLHGLVEDGELAALASDADLEGACGRMIALANERGGHDNITVLLARIGPER